MKRIIGFLMVVLMIISCKITKTQTSQQVYKWEGKEVTKKQYDKLLYEYTLSFVNNYPKKDDLKTFINLEVIYDTIGKKR